MMNHIDATAITFKSPLWIKIFIPFGIMIFIGCAIGMCWLSFTIGIMDKKYPFLIIFIPLAILMFYFVNMGFILFRYRNLAIEILNDKIRIINNGALIEHKWNSGLQVKDHGAFQVFEMFDQDGKRLFMIDYYFPRFSLLTAIIDQKISNPNIDLTRIEPMK